MSMEFKPNQTPNSQEKEITIEDVNVFGRTLRDILRVRKMTIKQLAEKLVDASEDGVGKWARGDNLPEENKLDAIARACDVSRKILIEAFNTSKKVRELESAAKKGIKLPKKLRY